MKKTILFWSLLCLFMYGCSGDQRPRTIDRPPHGLRNSTTIEIAAVEITDSATTLHIDAFFRPKQWIRIASDTYLQAGGEKLLITSSDGIELDTEHYMPDSGEEHFTLTFPALPKGTKTFDFIEGDCDDCFKVWDIDLTGKAKAYKSRIPASVSAANYDKTATLPEPEFRIANTKLTLHVSGWREGYALEPMALMVSNFFSGDFEEVTGTKENEDYIFDFEQYSTAIAFLTIGRNRIPMILAPGENAEVWIDLTAMALRKARYHPQPDISYIGISSTYSDVSRQLMGNMNMIDQYDISFYEIGRDPSLMDKSVEEYLLYAKKIYDDRVAQIEASEMPAAVKQIAKENLKGSVSYMVTGMPMAYDLSYRTKHNIDLRTERDYKYDAPEAGDKELEYLRFLDINSPNWIYATVPFFTTNLASNASSIEVINNITGSREGMLQDKYRSLAAIHEVETGTPQTEEGLASLDSASPHWGETYRAITAAMKKKSDEAMAKGGFEMLPTPDVANDKILESIIAQYKGKVVFVDFWATWCGPCLQAMKTIKPLKPEMAENGVVSVYISYTGSPKAKWLGMLPDIGGLHYYLEEQQWRNLSDKYSIQGIPHYMIFDKQGNKTYQTAGFPGVDKLREELGKVW